MVKQADEFDWRLDAAMILAEATPQGAKRFLGVGKKSGMFISLVWMLWGLISEVFLEGCWFYLYSRFENLVCSREVLTMSVDFDVIIVGSGPAGISAAFPLLESGLHVLMIDGGKIPEVQPPEVDFLSSRANDAEQWKWIIGENFHALKNRDAVSPKLRVPTHAYTFDEFASQNKITGTNFITVGSLASGGLSNSWGCGVAQYSAAEIEKFPFAASELENSYAKVSQRIGLSGKADDDMSDYFGLDEYSQPPIPMDVLHTDLSRRYTQKRKKMKAQGFRLGRSRVAVLSESFAGRQACNLSNNCLWGCSRNSLYSALQEMPKLRSFKNFTQLSGFIVEDLVSHENFWQVAGKNLLDNSSKKITAKKIVLAAGTLATTRIVLKAMNYRDSVPLLSSPTAAFSLWLPRFLGVQRSPGFGLGQLSYALSLDNDITGFGSTFSTTGIPVSEFARYVPLRKRFSIDLLSRLLSSCVVGNLFLPGHLTIASARLKADNSLSITGNYHDDVMPLMDQANKKLRTSYRKLGGVLLPGSFTVGRPGSDIHYAGSLPMQNAPVIGETSEFGEVAGLEGVYVVDGASLPLLSEKSHTLTIMANADRIGRKIVTKMMGSF